MSSGTVTPKEEPCLSPDEMMRSPSEVSSTTTVGGKKKMHPNKNPTQVNRRNARERSRVHQVNVGFKNLQSHVPVGGRNKKLSKVDTLRHAAAYIHHLQELLQMAPPPRDTSLCFSAEFYQSPAPAFSNYSDNYAQHNSFFSAPSASADYGFGFQTQPAGYMEPHQMNPDSTMVMPSIPQALKISPATSNPSPASSFLSDTSFDISPQTSVFHQSTPYAAFSL